MKKSLLLQTALVAAAGLFVADIANAQTKEVPIGVSVGGYMNQLFVMQDRDQTGQNQQDHRFAAPTEIYFNIRSVLADGTVIGGRVELEGQTYGDQVDERYLFIERADVGRVEIGSVDSLLTKMIYSAPNSLPNFSTTIHEDQVGISNGPQMRLANNNDDNERINLYTASNRYFGSKVGKGLQLGATYMPDACQDNTTVGAQIGCGTSAFLAAPTNYEQQYQIAANYIESVGPVDAALYVGWSSVKVVGAAGRSGNREDAWQAGALFTYNVGDGSSVQFGGSYSDEDLGVALSPAGTPSTAIGDNRKAYALGLRYLTNGTAPGSVGIGVEYWNREDDWRNRSGSIKQDYGHIGVTYQIANGILALAGVGINNVDGSNVASENYDQTFGVVGLNLTF